MTNTAADHRGQTAAVYNTKEIHYNLLWNHWILAYLEAYVHAA